MIRNVLLLTLLFFSSANAYETRPGADISKTPGLTGSGTYRGYIVADDGKMITGFLKAQNPIEASKGNQKKIKFLSDKVIEKRKKEGNKVKRKDWKKYTTKDISKYLIEREGKQYLYERLTYKGISKGIGLPRSKNKKQFALKVVSGEIDLYKFYFDPPQDVSLKLQSMDTLEEKNKARAEEVGRAFTYLV